MRKVISFLQENKSQYTFLHTTLMKHCYMQRQFEYALAVVKHDITDIKMVSKAKSWLQSEDSKTGEKQKPLRSGGKQSMKQVVKDVFRFFLFKGYIHLEMDQARQAQLCFGMCLKLPNFQKSVNDIQLYAFDKFILLDSIIDNFLPPQEAEIRTILKNHSILHFTPANQIRILKSKESAWT